MNKHDLIKYVNNWRKKYELRLANYSGCSYVFRHILVYLRLSMSMMYMYVYRCVYVYVCVRVYVHVPWYVWFWIDLEKNLKWIELELNLNELNLKWFDCNHLNWLLGIGSKVGKYFKLKWIHLIIQMCWPKINSLF